MFEKDKKSNLARPGRQPAPQKFDFFTIPNLLDHAIYALTLGALRPLWLNRLWLSLRLSDLFFVGFALLLATLVLVAARSSAHALAAEPSTPSTQPNVILIVADDLGYSDLGIYGSPDALTPHIDSIGEDGIRFENFYVSPVCTPTRFSLLTGLYVNRAEDRELHQFILPDMPDVGIRQDKATLAEVFKAQGNQTGIIGKWHLGNGEMLADPPEAGAPDSEFHPNHHGFDYFYGPLGGAIDYNAHWVWMLYQDWFENRNYIPGGEDGQYATHLFTRRAVNFIEQHADTSFFLYLPYTAPHSGSNVADTPLGRNQLPVGEEQDRLYLSRFDDFYPDDETFRKRYLAMIAILDDGIGEILHALDEQGIAENTIVIFLADNGADRAYGGSNALFHGGKGTIYEGGIRVPALIRWPGKISPGRTSPQFVHVTDMFPTLVGLTGNAPTESTVDGVDLSHHILDGDLIERDIHIANRVYGDVFRRGDWKYLRTRGLQGTDRLYNLATDGGETRNVAAQYPEKLAELKQAHAAWVESLSMETEPGTVIIRNRLIGQQPASHWVYSGNVDGFQLASNGRVSFQVAEGFYTISQVKKNDYNVQSSCSSGSRGGNKITIDVLPGSVISCTFTNVYQPYRDYLPLIYN